MTKILIIGDLHGAMPKIHFKEFDCIICVGDVCSDKEFRKYVDEMMTFRKLGIDISSEQLILDDVGKVGLAAMEKRSLNVGRKILKKLDSFGKPVFFVPGNWDQSYGSTRIKDMGRSDYNYFKAFIDFCLGENSNKKLVGGLKNVYDCQYELYEFLGFNIIGYGLTSGPESFKHRWNKFNFKKEEIKKLMKANARIEKRLNELFKRRNKKLPTVFLTHNIIGGTKLDKVMDKKSPAYGKHVGSDLGEKLCKKYKVDLAIGGHVHEHFGKARLGKTMVINAGFGKDKNILIDLSSKGIFKIKILIT